MESDHPSVDDLCEEFGEQFRLFITNAIAFLEKTEPSWRLDEPINRREFVRDLIKRARQPAKRQR